MTPWYTGPQTFYDFYPTVRKEAPHGAGYGERTVEEQGSRLFTNVDVGAVAKTARPVGSENLSKPDIAATGEVGETRGLLETVLRNRIAFAPVASGGYELTVSIAFDRLLVLAVPALARVYKEGIRPQRDWYACGAGLLIGK